MRIEAEDSRAAGGAIDFARWAVVAHKDDTGFGRMAADVRRLFRVGRHIVIPSERLSDREIHHGDELVLDPKASEAEVRAALAGLDGILFFERHDWHPALLPLARELGVQTVCVPMWEWFRGRDEQWRWCDLFVCPHEFSLQVVQGYGWSNAVHLPWPFDVRQFPARAVRGPARVFIHNAGLVDHDDRKSTRDTIRAFRRVARRDVRLIVRMQTPAELPPLDERIEVRVGNLPHPAALYAEGDVAIQPSKMEGIGFMVLEPVASGLPVITLDFPPMNEFVRQPELRVAPRWFKRRAFATNWVRHAHLRLPRLRDLAQKIAWCAENDLAAIGQSNRAWAEQTFDPAPLLEQWRAVLGQRLGRRAVCGP